MADDIYGFSAERIDGGTTPLSDYRGRPLLIVNTASACGFTPQYEGLQALHDRFGPHGFAVLGFPCNQFGAQEPGSGAEIQNFCTARFNVTFPLFAKIEVNGPGAHPLWAALKRQRRGILGTSAIKWNFTKFLIDRQGRAVRRYAPTVKPEAIAAEIEKLV